MMAISLGITALAVGGVFAIVGYRAWRNADMVTARAAVTAELPKGARVIGTAVSDGRIVVTVEAGGQTELHLFDLMTLSPRGKLTLAPAP